MPHPLILIAGSALAVSGFRWARSNLGDAKSTSAPDAMRFYAGFCDAYPYEPTKDRFQVVSTEEKGEGLAALERFEPGEIVFVFNGRLLAEQNLFTLQIRPGEYIEDPYVMGKVLHSCDPNMVADMETRTFRAVKAIKPGDFLTMDYETTEDALFRKFECGCGAPSCRGLIQGKQPVEH